MRDIDSDVHSELKASLAEPSIPSNLDFCTTVFDCFKSGMALDPYVRKLECFG